MASSPSRCRPAQLDFSVLVDFLGRGVSIWYQSISWAVLHPSHAWWEHSRLLSLIFESCHLVEYENVLVSPKFWAFLPTPWYFRRLLGKYFRPEVKNFPAKERCGLRVGDGLKERLVLRRRRSTRDLQIDFITVMWPSLLNLLSWN